MGEASRLKEEWLKAEERERQQELAGIGGVSPVNLSSVPVAALEAEMNKRFVSRKPAVPSVPKKFYPAVCAACNEQTEVPFEPRSGSAVFCLKCFRAGRK